MTAQHHYLQQTSLPYITNANVVETQPHFVAGSNVMSSLRGFCQKRPGTTAWETSPTTFADPVKRLFQWRLWASTFIVICNTVGSTSKVYKYAVGTDTSFQLIYTSTTATAFDFSLSNNQLYFGNGVDMKKYDGSTVTNWGIAKPAAAPTVTSGGGSLSTANGGWSYKYAFGNSTTTH